MGKSFLDQYSVFCVFGSVVGCVVVPLITQSVESLIFSAIVISLTANRFSKKVVIEPSIKGEGKEPKNIRGSKEKDLNLTVCKKKKRPPSTNINGNQNALYHQLSPSELRRQYQEEAERREYEKLREIERKEEEKRERKLKKKEERLKRKNHEKKEPETKPYVAKEKPTSPSEKGPKSGGVLSSPKSEERSARHDRTTSTITTAPSPTSYNSNLNMNSVSARKKYDYFRPNIPRFARQAARQRQMGYGNNGHWNNRSTPSPDNSITSPTCENIPDTAVIQPKVQSVIGCRKSPEPPCPNENVASAGNGARILSADEKSRCYTLFGATDESKDLLTIIRQETGLHES